MILLLSVLLVLSLIQSVCTWGVWNLKLDAFVATCWPAIRCRSLLRVCLSITLEACWKRSCLFVDHIRENKTFFDHLFSFPWRWFNFAFFDQFIQLRFFSFHSRLKFLSSVIPINKILMLIEHQAYSLGVLPIGILEGCGGMQFVLSALKQD